VLRHAAENGAIMANPLSVVRSPRSAPRDAARPLAPAVVERIREAMLNPPDREISASAPGQRVRRRYTLPALSALAQDIREHTLAIGRPPETTLILLDDDGRPWDKNAWQIWRADRWAPACRAVGLDPVPRSYDVRHSFASLLLAEGK
jgi:hypothetical protein